jgi:hypothetical protein
MPDLAMIALILAGIFAGILAIVLLVNRWPQRRRSAELRQLAAEIGWEFSRARDIRHDDIYAAFSFFQPRGGMARNTLWGVFEIDGVRYPAKAGDFVQIEADAFYGSTSREFTYLVMHLPGNDLPNFSLEPTGVAPRPGEPLGDKEIAYETGDFQRQFAVHTGSPEAIDRVLDAEMQRLLQASPGPRIELTASRLCLADGRYRWTTEELRMAFKLAGELCRRLARSG